MSVVTPNKRPVRLSAGIAVGLALLAVALLATGPVTTPLGVEVVGLGLLVAAAWIGRAASRVVGLAVGAVALVIVVAAVGLVWVRTGDLLTLAQAAPGMVGVAAVTLGVLPVRGNGSRWVVKFGTALVLLGVFVGGVVEEPGVTPLLLGGVATVLAWDAAEHAIGVGTQLGRTASTWPIEVSHLVASFLVGGIVVASGRVVHGLGSPGLDLGPFVILIVGLLALTAALYG